LAGEQPTNVTLNNPKLAAVNIGTRLISVGYDDVGDGEGGFISL
jgi:hypothetical protein